MGDSAHRIAQSHSNQHHTIVITIVVLIIIVVPTVTLVINVNPNHHCRHVVIVVIVTIVAVVAIVAVSGAVASDLIERGQRGAQVEAGDCRIRPKLAVEPQRLRAGVCRRAMSCSTAATQRARIANHSGTPRRTHTCASEGQFRGAEHAREKHAIVAAFCASAIMALFC